MKKIILFLAVLFISVFASVANTLPGEKYFPVVSLNDILNGYAQLPQISTTPNNWIEDSFSAGDTTATITGLSHASVFYFLAADSTMTGTDSLWLGIQVTLDNGRILKAPIAVHNLFTTTITTYVTPPIIPGAGLTACFVWYPANVGGAKFSGSLHVARLNVNDNVTPYLPVTRWAYAWE